MDGPPGDGGDGPSATDRRGSPGPRHVGRRGLLAATASGLLALAGCGGDGSDGTTTDADPGTDATSRPRTPTRTPTATATRGPPVVEFDGGGAAAFADALRTLSAEPGATLRVAGGRHRLDATAAPADAGGRTHFALRDATDVTIEGGDATLVCEDPTRGALLVADSEGVSVTGLTVDYDPVPFSQAVVRSLSADRRTMVVEVQSGFPTLSHPLFGAADRVPAVVHRRDGSHVDVVDGSAGQYKRFAETVHLGGRRYRLELADGVGAGGLAVDRLLVVTPRFHESRALRFHRCSAPRVADVTIRASPGYSLYLNYCSAPVVRGVTVAPPRGGDRAISANADGVHVDNCRDAPLVEGCRLVALSDDPLVVDAQLPTVTEVVDDRTVRVRPVVGSIIGSDDRLAAATAGFERLGELPAVVAVDVQGGGWGEGPGLPEAIRFADPVADRLSPGDYLTARAFENRGFVVRDNEVRGIHGRAIRVGGGVDGLVAGNRCVGTNNDGVLVEANGGASPKRWVDDLTVRDNVLREVGLVSVTAGRPEGIVVNVDGAPVHDRTAPSPAGRPHRNVTVTGNRLEGVATTGIHLADAVGATVADNRVVDPGRVRMTDLDPYGVGIDHSVDVAVTGNRVVGTGEDVAGFGWVVDGEDVRASGNALSVAGTERAARLERM